MSACRPTRACARNVRTQRTIRRSIALERRAAFKIREPHGINFRAPTRKIRALDLQKSTLVMT
jgi:hypothetical protein